MPHKDLGESETNYPTELTLEYLRELEPNYEWLKGISIIVKEAEDQFRATSPTLALEVGLEVTGIGDSKDQAIADLVEAITEQSDYLIDTNPIKQKLEEYVQ